MTKEELLAFMRARTPERERFDTGPYDTLPCEGCAHSASGAPFPGRPSGERPCMSCSRNPQQHEWTMRFQEQRGRTLEDAIVVGTDGVARCMDPSFGTNYNGAPRPHFPSDNYVTLSQRDQERFFEEHPAYRKAITFKDGVPTPVEDSE